MRFLSVLSPLRRWRRVCLPLHQLRDEVVDAKEQHAAAERKSEQRIRACPPFVHVYAVWLLGSNVLCAPTRVCQWDDTRYR